MVSQRFCAHYASEEGRADAHIMEMCDWLVAAACSDHEIQHVFRRSMNEHVSESVMKD